MNMYGYADYRGPTHHQRRIKGPPVAAGVGDDDSRRDRKPSTPGDRDESDDSSDDNDPDGEDDDDPLLPGRWMEGDSLAPPCGTSPSVVRSLLSVANVEPADVLYDLGCGDGRVCLEAYWNFGAKACVGVEIEEDLVRRFRQLVAELPAAKERRRRPVLEGSGRDGEPSSIDADGDADGNGQSDDVGGTTALTVDHEEAVLAVRADLRDVLASLVERFALEEEDADGEEGDRSAEPRRCSRESGPASSSSFDEFRSLPRPTVITLYLLPSAVALIEPDLIQIMRSDPALRVVCSTWGLSKSAAGEPRRTEEVHDPNDGWGGCASTLIRVYTGEGLPCARPDSS